MTGNHPGNNRIRVALAGVGNCAGSLVEGIAYYRQAGHTEGLLFPVLAGYSVTDIEFVLGFDISAHKVGGLLNEAIYETPNNFVRTGVQVSPSPARVFRGPTLDGNPAHLQPFVPESREEPVAAASLLREHEVDVLVYLLPTGSHEAARYYAAAAVEAGCAFINGTPSLVAQDPAFHALFAKANVPLLGDDIKSQVGTTILHRALLHMLEARGARLQSTSQVNLGGNTDFANFVHRAESKLVSKRKSLHRYAGAAAVHVGHHYDPTRGPNKHALIEVESTVFGGSPVKISVRLESDDKPNAAGSLVDLIRIAAFERQNSPGGVQLDASAYYMKSPPEPVDDYVAFQKVLAAWAPDRINELVF
jgi:myo-inositol-1-phosphate synthase